LPLEKGSHEIKIDYSEAVPYKLTKNNINITKYGGYNYLEYDLSVDDIKIKKVEITQHEGSKVKYVQIVPLTPCTELKTTQTQTGYVLSFKPAGNTAKFNVKIAAETVEVQEPG